MKKKYYLIIPSSDIYVKNKDKDIVVINHTEGTEIFEKYNIPKQFQKIVVKVSLKNNIAKELLTHSIYYIKESIIKSITDNNQNISMDSIDNLIDTKLSIYSIDAVKAFYQSIIDNKLSVSYEKAVKEIYKYHYLKEEKRKTRKLKRNEYIH